MRKRWCGLGMTLALTLSGCGIGSAQAADGPVELTLWHGYTESDGDALNKIIADFNASQHDVHINVQVKTWDIIGDTLLPALSAKQGPQLVAMPAEQLPVYASKRALVNLDDFYATDANAQALNSQAVDMEVVNGAKFGIPIGFAPLAVYYNKDLFKKAGIADFPTTWDQWVTDANAMTIDADHNGTPEQYGLLLPDHASVANGLWPALFEGGGGQITQDGTTAVIDSSANARTLKYWANAISSHHISPTGLDGVGGDKLFEAGKAAMHVSGPWMATTCNQYKLNCGIAAIPAGPSGQASSAIGISLAITAQSSPAQIKAAEEFFDYFYSKQVSITWSLGSGWPPLRTDISASQVAANPTVAALTPMTSFTNPLLPGVTHSTDVITDIDTLTQKAISGGSIPALLSQAENSIQHALDKTY